MDNGSVIAQSLGSAASNALSLASGGLRDQKISRRNSERPRMKVAAP